ncbi:MAG: hypothetical protein WD873_04225 [Candidatus Hydrogenedentales bacterium]
MHSRKYVVGALLTSLAVLAATVISAQEIEWVTDYHEGLELAKTSGKPIFLTYRCVP